MTEWLMIALGAGLGGLIAWVLAGARAGASVAAAKSREEELRRQLDRADREMSHLRDRLQRAESASIAADTRFQEAEKQLTAQQDLLAQAKTTLTDVFKSVAAEALAGNNAGFLALAEEKFQMLRKEASAELQHRQGAIEALIQPLAQTLAVYQQETKALEHQRLREVSAVGEQLRQLAAAQSGLQTETAKLVNALRSPHVRGRWGEIALRRTAELAGMSSHCDFLEQASVDTETGRLRPDMVVRLPSHRTVVVDAKVPLGGFLEGLDAENEQDREAAMARHAAQVKQHVGKLASKDYWEPFAASPEFVVLFIPNDSFLAAAAEKDPALIEFALAKNVIIATPTTFIALLRTVAYGWRQEQVAEGAQRISALGQELADRMGLLADHLRRVGGALGKAVESYNAAVTSLESRVFPAARKFRQLGIRGKKDLEEVSVIERQARPIVHDDEWTERHDTSIAPSSTPPGREDP